MTNDKALFPHQKLDWTIADLEKKSQRSAGNTLMLLQLAKCHLSKGLFHGGGEQSCTNALRQGQRILAEESSSVDALAINALALIGMDRVDSAQKYLHKAQSLDDNNTLLHLALGSYYRAQYKMDLVIKHLERVTILAPKAWEPHLFLGRTYLNQAQHKKNLRAKQKSLFHFVQALQSNGELEKNLAFLKDIGLSCLHNQRAREAEKYFNRLRQDRAHQTVARYFMGLVAFDLEKYNNAVQHFRAFLQEHPDRTDVLAKQAEGYFLLGDYSKARTVCAQCLSVEQYNLEARLILGKSILAQGDATEAIRVFKETLKEAPEHVPSFQEIIKIRRKDGDLDWLATALRAEVAQYGSLPSNAKVDLQELVRQRIGVVLFEVMMVGAQMIPEVLNAINHTQDENLRFALWEVACAMTEEDISGRSLQALSSPSRNFSIPLGETALSSGPLISEEELRIGLNVSEVDLKRAAIDRYPPAHDVQQHRSNEEKERKIARGYQAMLLLAIASHRSSSAVALLQDWSKKSDADMAVAARIGLALNGDTEATKYLEQLTRTNNRKRLLHRIKQSVDKKHSHGGPRVLVSATEKCHLCSKSGRQVHHFLRLKTGGVCDECIAKSHNSPLASDDATCHFCSSNFFRVDRIVSHQRIAICSSCQDHSQHVIEKKKLDEFFADQGWSVR